uniref:Uncharacterized protein n=1 Tax=Hommersandiophycus borowitzkae TaxID=268573 RepID=A0A1G4NTU1_9FLOR|nr:Hypothetical protein ORF_7 [Hommersandiophycus borowitzkae]SCW22113.1 Hypothetical protein ORF_7 [Hommersandiophycus borowitzkae]
MIHFNIHSNFIKVWNHTFTPTSKSQIRTNKLIPQYIRVLLTNNGSFTRNSTIIYQQLTDIILVQEYTERYSPEIVDLNIKTYDTYQRKIWLTNTSSKKKLFLLNPIVLMI